MRKRSAERFIGQRFGLLLVEAVERKKMASGQQRTFALVRCDCGKTKHVHTQNLPRTFSCGCGPGGTAAGRTSHTPGDRFERLTLLGFVGFSRDRKAKVRCDCGNERLVNPSNLYGGSVRSCGCLAHEIRTARDPDAASRHPLWSTWIKMHQRCTRPNHPGFADYGGRGIRVCERWSDFWVFAADMGPKPSAAHSIDRINNDGGYEPGNCRWATAGEQNRNTRRNHRLTLNGETLCLSEWARRLGCSRQVLDARLGNGWPVERVLTEPVNSRRTGGHRAAH